MPLPMTERKYTVSEYFEAVQETNQLTELINGEIVMQAAPNERHHDVASGLFVKFVNHVAANAGKCKPFIAPFDVVLNDFTVVQPDVFILCDRSKSDGKRVHGAPDLAVEVTSSNKADDYSRKLRLYSENGVREYWIIDIERRQTTVFVFGDTARISFYDFDKPVPVGIWDNELLVNISEMLGEI